MRWRIAVSLLTCTLILANVPSPFFIARAAPSTVGGSGYESIQAALDDNTGSAQDIITVEAGTYDGYIVENKQDIQITTNGSVVIQGRESIFDGVNSTITILNSTGIDLENMCIDGQHNEQKRNVGIYIVNSSVTLRNITVQHVIGSNTSTDLENMSFAVAVANDSSVTIDNCTMQNNQVGFICANATATIEDSTIRGKTNNRSAGAYIFENATVVMNNTVIHENDFGTDNSSRNNSIGFFIGGGTTTVTITNCTCHNNSLAGYVDNGTGISIQNNSIYNNEEGIHANISIVATYNWWGSQNGPNTTENTFNEGQQGNTLATTCSFIPWLDAVHTSGEPYAPITDGNTGYYVSLAAAIENATNGTMLTVQAGSYNQSGTSNKKNISNFDIKGTSNAGTCFSNISISLENVSNVIIQNISIADTIGTSIEVTDFENVSINNCQISNATTGILLWAGGTQQSMENNTIHHCIISRCTNGILLGVPTENESEILDLSIHNNTFDTNYNGMNTSNDAAESVYINVTNMSVANNTFTGNTNGIYQWQTETLNAPYNYWFDHSWDSDHLSAGPSGVGIGDGDEITGSVKFSPFYAGHITTIVDEEKNVTIDDNPGNNEAYGFDWDGDGTVDVWNDPTVGHPTPYTTHMFTTVGNISARIQLNGSGPYSGVFTVIVEYNMSYDLHKKPDGTGYNIIGIIEKEITAAEIAEQSEHILYISYWNESEQKWGRSYLPDVMNETHPDNYLFDPGEEALLVMAANDSITLQGFYPTTSTDHISIYYQYNRITRTGATTINASSLGQALTADDVNWSYIYRWSNTIQQNMPGFRHNYTAGGSYDFDIDPGDVVTIQRNETSAAYFRQEGW